MIDAKDALLLSSAARDASNKVYLEKIRNLTLCRLHTAIADGRTSITVDCQPSRLGPLLKELSSSGYSVIIFHGALNMYASVGPNITVSWGEYDKRV